MLWRPQAGVAELVDAPDLGSGAARRGGSSPFTRTIPGLVHVDFLFTLQASISRPISRVFDKFHDLIGSHE